jgi:hypothetical protein
MHTPSLSDLLQIAIQPAECAKWSEMQDSNLRPPGPKPGALPGCANLRKMVRLEGLEPPRREALEPKSSVSTNSTTGA